VAALVQVVDNSQTVLNSSNLGRRGSQPACATTKLSTASGMISRYQVKTQTPRAGQIASNIDARSRPVESRRFFAEDSKSTDFRRLTPRIMEPKFESIELVSLEGRFEDSSNLGEVRGNFQLFGRSSDRQVVHDNLPLLKSGLRNTTNFIELQLLQMLHADPGSCSQYRKHQPECAPSGPQQQKAQECKNRGDCIQNDHYLPVC